MVTGKHIVKLTRNLIVNIHYIFTMRKYFKNPSFGNRGSISLALLVRGNNTCLDLSHFCF